MSQRRPDDTSLFETALSSMGDGVVLTDSEGRITFMNAVAGELTGWTGNTAQATVAEVLVLAREDNAAVIENPAIHSLRVQATVVPEEPVALVSHNGGRIPAEVRASLLRDDQGTVTGAMVVFRDISKHRETERELQAAREKLTSHAIELRRSNEDLLQFAYVACHDLRSPLNTITQFAELLEREYGDGLGDGKDLLRFVTDPAKRMSNLVASLLSYAKVSAETGHPAMPIDANLELAAAIDNLQVLIQESEAAVTFDVLPVVYVEEMSLIQLFQNLIANAIRYRGPDVPCIHISVSDGSDEWVFSCRDNGTGIPPQYQEQIFLPFKRLHGPDRSGSGIGLAVCKRIIARHNGRIWVESAGDRGSTFFFALPKRA